MKNIIFLFLIAFLFSCGKDPDLIVKAHIKGLKKGTVYLKKNKDTSIVTVDSLVINGNSMFELKSDLESPEIFYLQLNKNASPDENILFFADKGVIEINTTLKNFVLDAKISGSEQHKALEEYLVIMSRFNDKNLELIKENFEAQKENDTAKLTANEKAFNSLIKSKYLYTVNFAISKKDNEIAPYLALTEIPDAQIKWLDTINSVLTPKVKTSKYGKNLSEFIKKRKALEN